MTPGNPSSWPPIPTKKSIKEDKERVARYHPDATVGLPEEERQRLAEQYKKEMPEIRDTKKWLEDQGEVHETEGAAIPDPAEVRQITHQAVVDVSYPVPATGRENLPARQDEARVPALGRETLPANQNGANVPTLFAAGGAGTDVVVRRETPPVVPPHVEAEYIDMNSQPQTEGLPQPPERVLIAHDQETAFPEKSTEGQAETTPGSAEEQEAIVSPSSAAPRAQAPRPHASSNESEKRHSIFKAGSLIFGLFVFTVITIVRAVKHGVGAVWNGVFKASGGGAPAAAKHDSGGGGDDHAHAGGHH